jgi:hypothetical protein
VEMAEKAVLPLFFGPAAITIHNDGYMTGEAGLVNLFQ